MQIFIARYCQVQKFPLEMALLITHTSQYQKYKCITLVMLVYLYFICAIKTKIVGNHVDALFKRL